MRDHPIGASDDVPAEWMLISRNGSRTFILSGSRAREIERRAIIMSIALEARAILGSLKFGAIDFANSPVVPTVSSFRIEMAF